MRHMVSLSEIRSTRTHTLPSMIDLQDQPPARCSGGLADPILTAVHDDCLTSDKGGIVAC
jgi:hypothetical protein